MVDLLGLSPTAHNQRQHFGVQLRHLRRFDIFQKSHLLGPDIQDVAILAPELLLPNIILRAGHLNLLSLASILPKASIFLPH
jgi:hypothetical protein